MKLLLKHLKKFLAALFLGFLAFAPPGTLIVIVLFALGLLGRTWFIVGVVVGAILLAAYAYIFRNKLLKSSFVKKLFSKFKADAPEDTQ